MGAKPYTLENLMTRVRDRAAGEDEFHQAVEEVFADVVDAANRDPRLQIDGVLERLLEPDRVISFRVTWEADNGDVEVNRGYRVQYCSAIGPYKGGLRFHPTVNSSILKFLAFEQTFKNALTGLPMGGGKGGSDFNPNGRSDREVNRFCTAFMTELHRHIGPDVDVPAGDINVGSREIGYLFGAYRRITNEFEGALTGKGTAYGGSELRTEATGFGLLHFVCHMLEAANDCVEGKTIAISGAGNVATHAAEKAVEMGGKVVTLSDSNGFVYDKDGFDIEKLRWVRKHKSKPGASLEDYTSEFGGDWFAGQKPWRVTCEIALPCATQNEIDEGDVDALIDNGCKLVAEGANMPLTAGAIKKVRSAKIHFAPAKAANAGGVAVSGLEISQNRTASSRTREQISEELHSIMKRIHDQCAEAGDAGDFIDYAKGANIAAFRKVAAAMLAQGLS